MTMHDHIKRNRRQVLAGIVVGVALAAFTALIRLGASTNLDIHEVSGALALGLVFLLPAGLAWLSLDRRPSLLPAAAWTALAVGGLSTVFLPLWLIPTILWFRAWTSRPVEARSPRWAPLATVGLAGLMIVSFVTLFSHQDPRCTQTLRDGSVIQVDAAERGFTSGWTFGLGNSSQGSSATISATISGDVVSTECESDRIVIGEAIGAGLLAGLTFALASRWPVGVRSERHDARQEDVQELTTSS